MKQVLKPCEHIKALMKYLEDQRLGIDFYHARGAALEYRCERCDEVIHTFYVANPKE